LSDNKFKKQYGYANSARKKKIYRALSEAYLILDSTQQQLRTLQSRVRFDEITRSYFGSLISDTDFRLNEIEREKREIKKDIQVIP
jgi:hypothetical protein